MSSEFTVSDYKLQAYLLARAKELSEADGRPSSVLNAVLDEKGLDVYIKKTESGLFDQESGMVPANSLTPVGALDFVAELPRHIYDTLTFEANVYKVYLNQGSEQDREISIPLPHNSQRFFGKAGTSLAREGNTFKQTRTFLQQEALQNEYFTSQRFVSEALTGQNASLSQGVQIGNIEIVRLGGNPAEIDTNITVKMTLFATQLDNYFTKYELTDEQVLQYLDDPDLSEELKRQLVNGVAWIDLLKINLDDGSGTSALEQYAADQGIETVEYIKKSYLNNSLSYNSSQQKIKLELKYNTEGLDAAVKQGTVDLSQSKLEEYKQQIRAQTEVYYLNLHQNAINFNAADRSVEIQIDYVASTGTSTISRETDLLFEPYLYEKELQLNDSICKLQKEINTEEAVLVLIDPFSRSKVEVESERFIDFKLFKRKLPGDPIYQEFDYSAFASTKDLNTSRGLFKVLITPEEKKIALEEVTATKQRISVIQANKLINGLYAYSLFPARTFVETVDAALGSSEAIKSQTRSNLLFIPKADVTKHLILGNATKKNYGEYYYFSAKRGFEAVERERFAKEGILADSLGDLEDFARAAQQEGFQDENIEEIADTSLGNIIDGDELNLEYVFFGDLVEVAFEVLASNNRFGETILDPATGAHKPLTLEYILSYPPQNVIDVFRAEDDVNRVHFDDQTIKDLEMFAKPFYVDLYRRAGATPIDLGVSQLGFPIYRLQQTYEEFGEILFTDVTYKNPANTNEEITINLADVPISMIEFKKWFVSNISSKRRKHLFLKNYIEMLLRWVSKLIGDAVAHDQSKTTDLEPPELLINTYFINADRYNFLPKFTESNTGGVRQSHSLDNRVKIGALKEYLELQSTNEARLNSKTLTVIGQTPNLKFQSREREGNKQKDKEVNIPHILYGGATKGLFNDISFQREDMQGLREARLFEGDSMYALDILREKYNATIRFRGNNFFKPGMMLYLNPASFGSQEVLGNSRDLMSPARLLGLGGYHLVIRVSHEIDLTTNVWFTYVDTQWQTYGEDDGVTKSKEDECETSLLLRLSNAKDFGIDDAGRPTADAQSILQEVLATGDERLIGAVAQQEQDIVAAANLAVDFVQGAASDLSQAAAETIVEIDRRRQAGENIDDILRDLGLDED